MPQRYCTGRIGGAGRDSLRDCPTLWDRARKLAHGPKRPAALHVPRVLGFRVAGTQDLAEDLGALDKIGDAADELFAPAAIEVKSDGVGLLLGEF